MVLTDRHFIAEHFDILFVIFGLVVQKICQFKVHIHFLLFVLIPEISTESFCTGPDLARVADRRDPGHVGIHVGRTAHHQV